MMVLTGYQGCLISRIRPHQKNERMLAAFFPTVWLDHGQELEKGF